MNSINNPKVSVIIPTYNSSKFVEEAINSIILQSYKNIEIIVIDDGSTDNTKDVLNKYINDSTITYCYQKNGGPGAARNRGIKESIGDFVCFLDSDDVYLPDSILDRAQVLKNYPEVGLCFSDYFLQTKQHQTKIIPHNRQYSKFNEAIEFSTKERNIYIFPKKSYNLVVPSCYLHTSSCMLRKSVLDIVGLFRTDIFCAEDNDLWLRISMHCKIAFIDKVGSIYKTHRSSLYIPSERYLKDLIVFLEDIIRKYSFDNETCRLLKKKLYNAYFSLGYYYFDKALFRKSRIYFLKSMKNKNKLLKGTAYCLMSFLPDKIIKMSREIKQNVMSN